MGEMCSGHRLVRQFPARVGTHHMDGRGWRPLTKEDI